MGNDKVKDLDDPCRDDHECGHKNRAHHGDNDEDEGEDEDDKDDGVFGMMEDLMLVEVSMMQLIQMVLTRYA